MPFHINTGSELAITRFWFGSGFIRNTWYPQA
jgi:hypothetical protein